MFGGVSLVLPKYAEDERGFFQKAFEKQVFEEKGICMDVAETFESYSKGGVVRGLHFQKGSLAQPKLVRVLYGEVYDVCVDIRRDSATFGKWMGVYLTGDNHKALYISRGFAHGFMVTGKEALMSYTCSGKYSPGGEGGIRYDDPEIGIEWPVTGRHETVVSERDLQLPSFAAYTESLSL